MGGWRQRIVEGKGDAVLMAVVGDWLEENGHPRDTLEVFGNVLIERFGDTAVKHYRLSTGKLLHFYRFRKAKSREAYIASEREKEVRVEAAKAARKASVRAARENFVNPYAAGQILYKTWGYEQTNVEWYRVEAVKGKTVTLQRLGSNVEETAFMGGWSTPVLGSKVGDPFRLTIQITCRTPGKPHVYLPTEFGSYAAWDATERPQGVYATWYA